MASVGDNLDQGHSKRAICVLLSVPVSGPVDEWVWWENQICSGQKDEEIGSGYKIQ